MSEPRNQQAIKMDDDKLADRLKGLEALLTERFLQDRELWQAVHARIDAWELCFRGLAKGVAKGHPSLVRDLVDELSVAEREARSLNYHDAFLKEVRSLRSTLAGVAHDVAQLGVLHS